ncbi:MAG: hypothetical protein KAK00_00980 [Nanoarchaeota archaeon]|nr:hypothetical protein [Nanoarchaeota archaeon]
MANKRKKIKQQDKSISTILEDIISESKKLVDTIDSVKICEENDEKSITIKQYLDIFYNARSVERAIDEFKYVKRSGKLRYLGILDKYRTTCAHLGWNCDIQEVYTNLSRGAKAQFFDEKGVRRTLENLIKQKEVPYVEKCVRDLCKEIKREYDVVIEKLKNQIDGETERHLLISGEKTIIHLIEDYFSFREKVNSEKIKIAIKDIKKNKTYEGLINSDIILRQKQTISEIRKQLEFLDSAFDTNIRNTSLEETDPHLNEFMTYVHKVRGLGEVIAKRFHAYERHEAIVRQGEAQKRVSEIIDKEGSVDFITSNLTYIMHLLVETDKFAIEIYKNPEFNKIKLDSLSSTLEFLLKFDSDEKVKVVLNNIELKRNREEISCIIHNMKIFEEAIRRRGKDIDDYRNIKIYDPLGILKGIESKYETIKNV